MLSRLFKPKWQHKDPKVRQAAVAQLSYSNPPQRETLNRIAEEDVNIDVRCLAISKLDDMRLLESISNRDLDRKILDAAHLRLASILISKENSSASLTDRIIALKATNSSQVVESVVENSQETELLLVAVEKLENQTLLCSVATSSNSATLRQAAAKRIYDQKILQTLSKSSKHHDKNVYRIAKKKLTAIRDQVKESSENLHRQEHLLKSMELLSKTAYSSLYSAKYHTLVNQWTSVHKANSDHMNQRFEQLRTVCEQTISAQEAKALEHQQHVQQDRSSHEKRLDLIHSIEKKLQPLLQSPYTGEPTVAELRELRDHYQTRWNSAKSDSLPLHQEQKRFDRSSALLGNLIDALQHMAQEQDNTDRLLKKAHTILDSEKLPPLERLQQTKTALSKTIARIAWPEQFPRPARLNQTMTAIASLNSVVVDAENHQSLTLQNIETKLQQLSRYLDEGSIKPATKLIGEIRELVNHLGKRKTTAIAKELSRLSLKLDELNDWNNFAATPKKERLIEKMQQLLDSDLPMQDRANRIKELQESWKTLGRGGKGRAESDELWSRFRQATDAAYEPCKAYFSDQRALRKENLAQRKVICDELENFIKSADWEEIDWKAVDKIIHLSRDEWKKHSPVDRSPGRTVQNRFERLVGKLNDKLSKERKRNAQLKQELVDQVEALAESEELQNAITRTKQLQKEWGQIGITFHSDDRRLWKNFRTACDQIFDRRSKENQARDEVRLGQLKLAESLCEQLEQAAAVELTSWDDSAIHINTITSEFKSLGPFPRVSQSVIENRFVEAIERYKKRTEQYHIHLQEQKSAEAKMLSGQCAEIENRALLNELALPDSDIEQLMIKLDNSSLDASFSHILRRRVDNAIESIGNPRQLTAQAEENLHTLRLLCIQLEVLTQTESPVDDQELRMTYQVNRLADGMTGSSGKPDSTKAQISRLALEWLSTGPVNEQAKSILQHRWDQTMANYLNNLATMHQ